jgi:hypothetical protein
MFDLSFFYREKLALDPVVLTRLTQEPPPPKGFKVPAIDVQGNKRVTYINAPIFVEFVFFAHYEGLQDRRALDDDGMCTQASPGFIFYLQVSPSRYLDKKELLSSKNFEVIIKNPEKYKPLLSNGIFLVFKEFGRPLDDVFPFTAAQTYCM